MRKYVVGFALDFEQQAVLLICKSRPEWQRGALNGIGGGIEKGEKPADAMVREFKEEVADRIEYDGFGTEIGDWNYLLTIEGPFAEHDNERFSLSVFHIDLSGRTSFRISNNGIECGEGNVNWYPTGKIVRDPHFNCVENVRYLVAMAVEFEVRHYEVKLIHV